MHFGACMRVLGFMVLHCFVLLLRQASLSQASPGARCVVKDDL